MTRRAPLFAPVSQSAGRPMREFVVALLASMLVAAPAYAARAGEPAPAFALTTAAGDTVDLARLRGRVVYVDFWASWCAPCRTEAPLLERAASASGPDVVFLGVASKDERSAALDFLNEFDITYPNVLDSTGAIRARLGLRGFPTTYIVGRDGRVRTTVIGGISEQRLAAQLEDALRA